MLLYGTANQEPAEQPALTLDALRKARALLGPMPKRPPGIMSYWQFDLSIEDARIEQELVEIARSQALAEARRMGTDETSSLQV